MRAATGPGGNGHDHCQAQHRRRNGWESGCGGGEEVGRTQAQDVHRRRRRGRRSQGLPSHGRGAQTFHRHRPGQGLYRRLVFHADARLVRVHQGRSATLVRHHSHAAPHGVRRRISNQARGRDRWRDRLERRALYAGHGMRTGGAGRNRRRPVVGAERFPARKRRAQGARAQFP